MTRQSTALSYAARHSTERYPMSRIWTTWRTFKFRAIYNNQTGCNGCRVPINKSLHNLCSLFVKYDRTLKKNINI